ncbi:MAG: hypothetical protein R3F51_13320 [Cyanobacteriota/Melainabacteria group bacterium]
MISDIVRAIIQRIFRDKILIGLVIIGFLAIFMTGTQSSKEPPISGNSRNKEADKQVQGRLRGQFALEGIKGGRKKVRLLQANNLDRAAIPGGLKPGDAEEFVKQMVDRRSHGLPDPDSRRNRQKAMEWMTPEAAEIFKNSFWNSDIKNGITSGSIVAAFHPVSVSATALNPDTSVFVRNELSGNTRAGEAYPNTEHLLTDYLVVKESEGFRIAGVHSKTYEQAAAPTAIIEPRQEVTVDKDQALRRGLSQSLYGILICR